MIQKCSILLFTFCCLFIMGSCAPQSSPPKLGISETSETIPGWCELKQRTKVNQTTYLGRSDQIRDKGTALNLARADALSLFTNELGVTIRAESKATQRELNGVLSSDVTVSVSTQSSPVTVRGIETVREFVTSTLPQGYMGCVEIKIPMAETLRLKRLVLRKSLLVVNCQSENLSLDRCRNTVANKASEILANRGAKLLPGITTGDLEPAFARAMKREAAHILAITINSRFIAETNGEFYAEAEINLQQVDSTDRKTVQSIQVGPVKGGHYSKADAEIAAMLEALEALREQIEKLSF